MSNALIVTAGSRNHSLCRFLLSKINLINNNNNNTSSLSEPVQEAFGGESLGFNQNVENAAVTRERKQQSREKAPCV